MELAEAPSAFAGRTRLEDRLVNSLAGILIALLVVVGAVAPTSDHAAQAAPPVSSQPPTTAAQPAGAAQQAATTFKAGTELVALNVTVTDQQNHYLKGLSKEDFAVYEHGVRQDVTFFATSNVPVDLAILLDTSSSMVEKLPFAQEAAVQFSKTLRPGDRGEVMAFSDEIEVLQPFTGASSALETAIRSTRAHGGTSLYNAIYIALQELSRLNRDTTEIRRSAIVVLTDGEDTSSLLSFDDVLDRVKRTGIAIYPIRVVSLWEVKRAEAEGTSGVFSQSDYGLKTLAQETGAQVFFPVQLRDLNGVYQQIAEELSVQYSLGYPPKNTRADGAFRRVMVQLLNYPEARSRTRSGYYAPGSATASVLSPGRQPGG
jgi:Ca-activated chloride channel family protein